LACHQAGLPVRVYERRGADHRPPTQLLELPANGSRVLNALGLRTELAALAVSPAFSTIRNARTGLLLSQRPLGQFSESRYGAPCWVLEAGALLRLLRDACASAGIPVQWESPVTAVRTDTGTLELRDGRRAQHLAVAIASGVAGEPQALANLLEVRTWHAGAAATVVRGTARRAEPSRDHARFIHTWTLEGGYVIERPFAAAPGDHQTVELTLVHAAPNPGTATDLAAVFRPHCHPTLRALLDALDTASVVATPSAACAEHWQAGRAALLGAACHAPATYAEYGPAAALEDAWVLSRMMERTEDEPHLEFAEYERFRRPRARRLKAHADAELALLTLTDRRSTWRRNLKWSFASRFLPELEMQRLDWLYGYDCIRGFA
jgi:2-polyprenyl-6-methoxyphenol hydroxylase-like FAD-dependent oxidoreductase